MGKTCRINITIDNEVHSKATERALKIGSNFSNYVETLLREDEADQERSEESEAHRRDRSKLMNHRIMLLKERKRKG